jgi:hypothetical protein
MDMSVQKGWLMRPTLRRHATLACRDGGELNIDVALRAQPSDNGVCAPIAQGVRACLQRFEVLPRHSSSAYCAS